MSTLSRGVRVLARVPDWLGDLVMAEPALRALHARVRELDGRVTFAGSARLLDVFGDAFRGVARVSGDDAREWRDHDVAVLFTNSFRSAWLAARADIPQRVGYARDLRSMLLTRSFTPAREVGGVAATLGVRGRGARFLPRPYGATCVELVHWLGVSVRDTPPRLSATSAARDAANERLRSFGIAGDAPFVLANVGARAESAKGYPAESWGRVLRELDEPIVLVAGPGEEVALTGVRELVPRARACVEPLADLRELVALCERAALVVTADSGPRHVANAVGAPLVVVCGPTDPRHTADHTSTTRIVRVPVDCGPCHREVCPLGGEDRMRCMGLVEAELVVRAVRASPRRLVPSVESARA